MEIIIAIVLICLGATAAILLAIARAQTRRQRRAWRSYYDSHGGSGPGSRRR